MSPKSAIAMTNTLLMTICLSLCFVGLLCVSLFSHQEPETVDLISRSPKLERPNSIIAAVGSQPKAESLISEERISLESKQFREISNDLTMICERQEVSAASKRCADIVATNINEVFPPKSQDVVRCHGGSMVKSYTEEEIKKEWEDRQKVIVKAADGAKSSNTNTNYESPTSAGDPFDVSDAKLTEIALKELLSPSIEFLRPFAKISMELGIEEQPPRDPKYLSQVLHGGVSPATMVSQQTYMRDLLGLSDAFSNVEHQAKFGAKELVGVDKEVLTQWKVDLYNRLVRQGRISLPDDMKKFLETNDLSQLVKHITVHPDTVLVELGTGAGTVLYSMCPADPFDLSTACLGSDIVKVFVANSVNTAPHLRLTEGYGFSQLPPGSVTHVLSHGIATVICEECLCGHIAEALRLLRPNGTLVVWMIRSRHHNNNMDPMYFNGTYFGPDIGVLPPQSADAFFFMDKCRYKYGIPLSPYVDAAQLEVFLDYPTPLYSACWARDGFFGVRVRRSNIPWSESKDQVIPEQFFKLSLEEQLLVSINKLGNIRGTDLCSVVQPEARQKLLARLVENGTHEKKAKQSLQVRVKPSLSLGLLSPLMQTWILDLVLTNLAHTKVFSTTSHQSLSKEWCLNRIVDDMIFERHARIEHALWMGSKCKSGKSKYWCRNSAQKGKLRSAIPCH